MSRIAMVTALISVASCGSAAYAVTLSSVRVDANVIALNAGKPIVVRFQLDARARVELSIYDDADGLVRHVASKDWLSPGEHDLSWDLRDDRGKAVPPDAYLYTLRARSEDGSIANYDLSDVDRDAAVPVDAVKWQPETGTITYLLQRPARVKLRVGLQEPGPLLNTVLNMAARAAGIHEEPWDGMDASRTMDLARHAELAIVAMAYALPPNALLVGRATAIPATGAGDADSLRPPTSSARSTRVSPWELRDYTAQLSVGTPGRASGAVTTGGPIRLRIDVPMELRSRVLGRRLEPVFFVDGRFVFENEVGFLPMTWEWTPSANEAGERLVTVNLRGYDGSFGIATVKVHVSPQDVARSGGAGQ